MRLNMSSGWRTAGLVAASMAGLLLARPAIALVEDRQVVKEVEARRAALQAVAKARPAVSRPTSSAASKPATASAPADDPALRRKLEQEARQAELKLYSGVLRKQSIEPDVESMRKALRSLHPTQEQREKVGQFVAQLGDLQWRKREDAAQELMGMALVPMEQLRKASSSDDLEVATRAKDILSKVEGQLPSLLYAVFQVTRLDGVKGLAADIKASTPFCDMPYLQEAAIKAVGASAVAEDIELLRGMLKDESGTLRSAGLAGLAAVSGGKAIEEIVFLMKDPDPQTCLVAACAVAELGDRRSLHGLLDIMKCDDPIARGDASLVLSALTGNEALAFNAWGDQATRDAHLKAWSDWIAANPRLALRLPLTDSMFEPSYLNGNMLLCYGHRGKIEELDRSGKLVFSLNVSGAWSAEKLRNGNVLVAAYNTGNVQELTKDGNIVWEFSARSMSAKELRNGNILLADQNQARVIEVSRDKKIVWEQKVPGGPLSASRLSNGNTLVATHSAVIEMTTEGKIIWEYKGFAYTAQRLRNGNTLIADLQRGRVLEVTTDKKVVWEMTEQNPCDAYRLPNGNTMITSNRRAIEVAPDKQIVWEKTGFSYGSVRK